MSDRVEQLGDDIAAFVRDAQADELDAALLVGRAVAEEFDSGRCRTHVDALAERCPKATEPWSYLAGLGFAGNRGDHDAIACSRLVGVEARGSMARASLASSVVTGNATFTRPLSAIGCRISRSRSTDADLVTMPTG